MIEENTTTVVVPDEDLPFPCVKCGKAFASAQALGMHKIRVHTAKGRINHGAMATTRASHKLSTKARKNISAAMKESWKRRQGNQSEEERLAKRRAYQQRLRNRYYREGKNSKGEPRPPGWKPRTSRARAIQAKARRSGTGKWADPEFKRQYQRNLYRKYKAARNHQEPPQPAQTTSTTPDITGEAARAIMVAASVLRAVTVGMKITT